MVLENSTVSVHANLQTNSIQKLLWIKILILEEYRYIAIEKQKK